MADISMCMTNSCPSFNTCYRAMAKANPYRQSYADFKPSMDDGRCSDYIPVIIKGNNKQEIKK